MTTKPSILVTGASGTVGYEVLQQLIATEVYNIHAFDVKTPRSEKLLAPLSDKVKVIYGNIARITDVAHIPKEIDTVIHLAAIIPPLADEKPNLAYDVNVEGTRALIAHLQRTSPKAFFLYSSSVAVYGDRLLQPEIRITDAMQNSEGDVYAQTKIACEKILRESGLEYSIFRLTAIMKNHKISPIMFHMPLDTTMEICTPEDTATAFVEAIRHRDVLAGKVFNLGGGKECLITYRNFLIRSFNIYGLGNLNFPEHAFAERNFHCGIYADGDTLEDILHFRKDTLESYFAATKKRVSFWLYVLAVLFRVPVKLYLLLQSEPYRAYKTNNKLQMSRFFAPAKQISYS